MTTPSAALSACDHLRRRFCRLDAVEADALHHRLTAAPHEVVLEIELTFRSHDLRRDGSVRHRQDAAAHAQR